MAEHNHPPRWYCVNREGMATLCVDEEDAKANAAHCDLAWPNGGPHRAVQLVDAAAVAAERERCAKHIDVPYERRGDEFAEALRNMDVPIERTISVDGQQER